MINCEVRQEVHGFLILDLAIRSLQNDLSTLETLKMKKFYLGIVEQALKNLRHDYYNYKRRLAKKGIHIVCWMKVNEYFSDVKIATQGNDTILRYAKQALKSQVEQLLLHYMNK
ncbi:aconitate hydratase [Lysinibacillus piscis]|uniref:Aconitate hydratase n=1 Tax=Lysinibacillus piscis TaxID=2518931 RepID=A0ABQ5NLC9_9BACI|nr:aconitate hydratase [Lysinibacillus sp. KH24]GLC88923.1 hypothetical protein LYSBPC_20500 [Lysinibacillus sp. KH24]